jgi:hypothetical protein
LSNASAFAGPQTETALDGSQLVFVQRDGLVRSVDLATGGERVLPARTAENSHLRTNGAWAAWLSKTLEGHNVVLVPLA